MADIIKTFHIELTDLGKKIAGIIDYSADEEEEPIINVNSYYNYQQCGF